MVATVNELVLYSVLSSVYLHFRHLMVKLLG